MPGCPIGLEYELPLGPEGLKLAKAREVSARRNAGHAWPKWWDFLNEQSNVLPSPEPVRTEEG
jgi:hypothetical protein